MRKTPLSLFLSVALPSLLLAGCATVGALNSIEGTVANAVVTDEQESALGLQVKQELETKQHVKYVSDPQIVDYVRAVADKILVTAKQERPAVKWTVNVIDDPKTINAFATPGGYLYVYTGILLLANNEAELAGVMGHESGHVVANHIAKQMVDTYGLDAVAQLALGNNPGILGQIGETVAKGGAMLAHSRSDEDEADEFGARYASVAGYDPRALGTLFESLKAKMGDTSGLQTWVSDHPATSDRIAHINSYIASHNLGGKDLGADRFARIKDRVKKLPATAAGNSGAPSNSSGAPPNSSGAPPN